MSLMNSFAKLNLRTKLVIGFTSVVTFAVVISATAFYGLNMLQENTQKMYDKDLIGVSLLRSLNRDINVIGRMQFGLELKWQNLIHITRKTYFN